MKRSVAPPAAPATRSPDAAKGGVAGAQAEVVSSATSGKAAKVLLLIGSVLGALLVTIAVVIPGSAVRFTSPGRFVIEHEVDLAVLGLAVFLLTVLVYVLGTVGQ